MRKTKYLYRDLIITALRLLIALLDDWPFFFGERVLFSLIQRPCGRLYRADTIDHLGATSLLGLIPPSTPSAISINRLSAAERLGKSGCRLPFVDFRELHAIRQKGQPLVQWPVHHGPRSLTPTGLISPASRNTTSVASIAR